MIKISFKTMKKKDVSVNTGTKIDHQFGNKSEIANSHHL